MRPRILNTLSAAILVLLTLAAILVTLAYNLFDFSIFAEDDAITMKVLITVAGAAIAAAIALFFFSYSQKTDHALTSHLRYRRLVPWRAKRSGRARKARTIGPLHANICSLVNDCDILARMGGKSAGVTEAKWPPFRADLEALHCNATRSAAELRRLLEYADYPDDRTSDDILAAIDRLDKAPPIDDAKREVDVLQYRAAARSLGPVLDRLRRRLDLAAAGTSRATEPRVAPGTLALSLDRDAYPPGAPIRATVEADGQFPHHKVTVTIHDEGPDTLAENDGAAPVRGPERNARVAMDVIPKTRLAAGQDYIARATCGGLHDEIAFAVDNMAPTVQADRQTCTAGDDIVVTVVDPAVCAAGARTELAGTSKRRRLAVRPPCGRTRECRLEAGHPAGTFRCRLRCVDARVGEGAEGDAIPCEPDRLIRIGYESEAGVAWTAVLVEGPCAPAPASGEPCPASDGGGGGNDPGRPARGGSGDNGGGLYGADPDPRCRKGDAAGRVRGGPEGWSAGDAMAGASTAALVLGAQPGRRRPSQPARSRGRPQDGDRTRRAPGAARRTAASDSGAALRRPLCGRRCARPVLRAALAGERGYTVPVPLRAPAAPHLPLPPPHGGSHKPPRRSLRSTLCALPHPHRTAALAGNPGGPPPPRPSQAHPASVSTARRTTARPVDFGSLPACPAAGPLLSRSLLPLLFPPSSSYSYLRPVCRQVVPAGTGAASGTSSPYLRPICRPSAFPAAPPPPPSSPRPAARPGGAGSAAVRRRAGATRAAPSTTLAAGPFRAPCPAHAPSAPSYRTMTRLVDSGILPALLAPCPAPRPDRAAGPARSAPGPLPRPFLHSSPLGARAGGPPPPPPPPYAAGGARRSPDARLAGGGSAAPAAGRLHGQESGAAPAPDGGPG